MLSDRNRAAFVNFYDTVRDLSILDKKTTILVGLSAALASGCEPCTDHYLGAAEDIGITAEEVGAVQGMAMAVAAGRVNTLMRQVENRRKPKDR